MKIEVYDSKNKEVVSGDIELTQPRHQRLVAEIQNIEILS